MTLIATSFNDQCAIINSQSSSIITQIQTTNPATNISLNESKTALAISMYSKVEIYKILKQKQQYNLQKVSEIQFQGEIVNQTIFLSNTKLFSACDGKLKLYTYEGEILDEIDHRPQATVAVLWQKKIILGDQRGRISIYDIQNDQFKLLTQQQIYPFEVGFRDFDLIDNRLCCCSAVGICSIIDIQQIENEYIFNRTIDWQADYICLSQSKMINKDLILTCGSSKNVKLWQIIKYDTLGIQAIKLDQLITEDYNLVMSINREKNIFQVSCDKQIKIVSLEDNKFQVLRQMFLFKKAICGLLWLE